MREYKFRGKSTVCGYWVYGDHLKNDNKTYIISEFEDLYGEQDVCDTIDYYEVYPKTVGQYTGFHDRIGNEIYEGDMIKMVIKEFESYEDTTGYTEEYIIKVDKKLISRIILKIDDPTQFEKFEVIGNIYDNPDLLEVKS